MLLALVLEHSFPRALSSYSVSGDGLLAVLRERIREEPFNLVATIIFLLAIVHTFLAPRFRHWSHLIEEKHAREMEERRRAASSGAVSPEDSDAPEEASFWGNIFHFLGEIEAVFGIWAVILMAAIAISKGSSTAIDYIGEKVNFTEAIFVVVIMTLASTRPVLFFAEGVLGKLARLGRGSVGAWWLAVLIVAPLFGSFITEPAAMTIAAIVLGRQFYAFKPSPRLAYATIGLLFVNVSVGGTMTHFAAPPVLMVAHAWNWDTAFMLDEFGWRAAVGILISTTLYFAIFRKEFARLDLARREAEAGFATAPSQRRPVPLWITLVHVAFVAWTVFVAHYPALFVGAFLFFLAFSQATAHHQSELQLRGPLLVGFFLAGLVVHGGLQGWWIEPLLSRLDRWPLFFGATILTAFNDNAAITYLATLVPGFTESFKHAVVAGAVVGGGLTVIANAPNPAGQTLLQKYFPDGVSPLGLLLGALTPTILVGTCLMLL
ncbi:MAG TPA: putative Na+/H+ antiporter [Opitutaceae bacterium]|nr:putative Na+/H+ antiporter [Opitutaceae bacterium]